MEKKNLIAVIVLGEIIALFVLFILLSAGYGGWSLVVLFVILPGLALLGFYIAQLIGRRILVVFQFAKYALVGLANTAVDFGILNLLMLITGAYEGKTIILLNTISFLIAVVHSYFWNKFWTFRDKNKEKINNAIQFIQFIIVSIIGTLINTGIVYVISSLIKPACDLSQTAWVNIAKVIATIISLVWNFVGYKLIVFKETKEDGKQPSDITQV
jgi:putative flippase GtrA